MSTPSSISTDRSIDPGPIVTLSPITAAACKPVAVDLAACMMDLSWTFDVLPMTTSFKSPRKTAPYHTLLFGDRLTAPTSWLKRGKSVRCE